MPVGGEVLEINSEIESNPEVINSDPFGAGWLIKIKLSDSSELDGLLSAGEYKDVIG